MDEGLGGALDLEFKNGMEGSKIVEGDIIEGKKVLMVLVNAT